MFILQKRKLVCDSIHAQCRSAHEWKKSWDTSSPFDKDSSTAKKQIVIPKLKPGVNIQ